MNKKHLKNLEKLADFLETEVTDKQFDLDHYLYKDGRTVLPREVISECGTVGCALGWSSALFYNQARNYRSWLRYSQKVFGCSILDNLGKFMFDAEQKPKQKSRKATIKRIRKVVANIGEL